MPGWPQYGQRSVDGTGILIASTIRAGTAGREESHENGVNGPCGPIGTGDDRTIWPLPCNWSHEDSSTPRSSDGRPPVRAIVPHGRQSPRPVRREGDRRSARPDRNRSDRYPLPAGQLARHAVSREVRARATVPVRLDIRTATSTVRRSPWHDRGRPVATTSRLVRAIEPRVPTR